MRTWLAGLIGVCFIATSAPGARLSMAIGSSGVPGGFPNGTLRLDVIWTMTTLDTPNRDIDGFDARFYVYHPRPSTGYFVVAGVSPLPGWSNTITEGIGERFSEYGTFLSVYDGTFEGISGNGTTFSTTIATLFLEPRGNIAGTEISFRHESPGDPIPAAYDGPQNWLLRFREPVTGPFQFDIGAGAPSDDPYHLDGGLGPGGGGDGDPGQPLVIIPEPSSLATVLLSALALLRSRR